MNQTYMKEKPILPLLLSMALPMVISMMVNSLYINWTPCQEHSKFFRSIG